MAGLALLPPEKGPAYYENACRMSATAIRHVLEDLVSTTAWPVYSPFAREHFGRGKAEGIAEGKAEGEAEAILLVLEARGLEITAQERARIAECTDLAQLKAWVTRAATVPSTSDLFR